METLNELSRTLGKMEQHLSNIDEKLDGISKNEERIRSLESSRSWDRGYKAAIVAVLGYLGYDKTGGWF